MPDVWSLSQFSTQPITTMKGVFGDSGRLPFACVPTLRPESITSCLLPCLPFFLASQRSLAHLCWNILIQYHRTHLVFSMFSNCGHISTLTKQSASSILQCRGPSQCCFKWSSPLIIHRCIFLGNPATHPFFHLLNVLKLGFPILLANCVKENSVYFMLIGALPSAPPMSD